MKNELRFLLNRTNILRKMLSFEKGLTLDVLRPKSKNKRC